MTARERLKNRIEELGIEPKKSLGQNFLINDAVIEKILKAAEKNKGETLIEVGPGLGALTDGLRKMTDQFTVIEYDRQFAEYWRVQNLNVIEDDALKVEWQKLIQNQKTMLVSNLPYQISSSLVIDRSLDQAMLATMILMFQKEVAQRLKATPDVGSYGFLSVIAQTFWKIEMLLEAGPGDFWPPPKIASRVLIFQRKDSPVSDKHAFLKFIKACFSQPRKLMVKNLQSDMGLSKEQILKAFEKHQIKDKTRAEELELSQFLDLYRSLGYK
jgi:16S rRNA (adenine1518-N6/adenine1519-N6)-dimethyltransferase